MTDDLLTAADWATRTSVVGLVLSSGRDWVGMTQD